MNRNGTSSSSTSASSTTSTSSPATSSSSLPLAPLKRLSDSSNASNRDPKKVRIDSDVLPTPSTVAPSKPALVNQGLIAEITRWRENFARLVLMPEVEKRQVHHQDYHQAIAYLTRLYDQYSQVQARAGAYADPEFDVEKEKAQILAGAGKVNNPLDAVLQEGAIDGSDHFDVAEYGARLPDSEE